MNSPRILARLALTMASAAFVAHGAVAAEVVSLGAAGDSRVLGWGDQGDGTYRNPVLKADYSDPDVIRVGGDFYLVASDFHFVGIQVLHSRDLVNWRIVGHRGRVAHLLPVTWGADGWPVFGERGRMVERWRKPAVSAGAEANAGGPSRPGVSDEFGGERLGFQWQWNHNPVRDAFSLTEREGWLRLRGLPAAEPRRARNTLTQKLWDEAGVVDVKVDASGLSEGQRAGFTFISGDVFSWIGVTKREGVNRIRYEGDVGPPLEGDAVWLRGIYEGDAARLFYSLDGARYVDTGLRVQLRFGQWKGARVGLFCHGEGGGGIDVDYFRYRCAGSLAELAVEREVEVAAGVKGLWCEPVGTWDGRTVLLYHSFADDRDGPGNLLKRLAQELAAKGVASLRVNFRGEGDKARTRIESTLHTRIADAEAAWRFAATQRGVDVSRIGALGWSLGATTAIETAGRNPAWFRSIAVWSSPSGDQEREMLSRDVARRALRDGEATQHDPTWKSVTTTRAFYESFRGVNLDRSLQRFPGAFFSVRGSADHLAPYETQFMKNRAGTKVPAESLLISGANHVFDVFAPEKGYATRAVDATVDWFLRTL